MTLNLDEDSLLIVEKFPDKSNEFAFQTILNADVEMIDANTRTGSSWGSNSEIRKAKKAMGDSVVEEEKFALSTQNDYPSQPKITNEFDQTKNVEKDGRNTSKYNQLGNGDKSIYNNDSDLKELSRTREIAKSSTDLVKVRIFQIL